MSLTLARMEPAHMRQISLHPPSRGDQLGCNRNCNFLWRDGSDVESNRGMHPFEQIRRKPFFGELLKNCDGLSLRADHSDIAGWSLHRPSQYPHVIAMPASDDHEVSGFTRRETCHGQVEVFSDDLFGFGKAFTVGVALAVIHHSHVETGAFGSLVKIYGNMTCTENI